MSGEQHVTEEGTVGTYKQCEMDIAPSPSELSWEFTGEHDQSPANVSVVNSV